MLSVPADRPLDRLTVTVLREVNRLIKRLGLNYFVCGAVARDVVKVINH